MNLVASDVTLVIVKSSGHWILEEQPKQTTDALISFL
jgi:pimeloyl-ACP methyl ester carboxylesterase